MGEGCKVVERLGAEKGTEGEEGAGVEKWTEGGSDSRAEAHSGLRISMERNRSRKA